ncbi:MAG: glycosyltransferase family 2 protein [Candidatus Marsarchaeota archaeon]|nr:glycosyltransferase family 2 protein [Candidatus Marsarchaeota archaeon]MCL5106287.1 glycosyltransferase family 2 protein [Candidatus Marsarchaeota archaeon]
MPSSVSIVIPTLDEEGNIARLLFSINKEINAAKPEIIVVDGHSSDKTVKIAKANGAKVYYDSHGKGSALIKGISESKGRIVVFMDADLSHRPAELKRLISAIESGYDVCMGSRFLGVGGSDDISFIRRMGNYFFIWLINSIYGSKYTDICYGYRSFSRNALEKLNLTEINFGIETEISIKAKKMGLKVLEIPSFERKRHAGVGKLMALRDGLIILSVILKNI